jgi:diketogulonate reductase-like aldo/keto reductase
VIEHIGITNTNVTFLEKLENELHFIPMTTQNQYSILDRRPEKYLLPYILKRKIGLYCYGSLM